MKNLFVFALSILFLGSASLLFVAKKDNDGLYRDLMSTRTKADSLSTAAGLLQANSDKFKNQADSLTTKNGDLKKSLSLTTTKLSVREREISKNNKALEETTKNYNDALASQKDLESQMKNLKTSNEQMQEENKNLTNKYTLLSETNNQLNGELANALLISKDNILIEGFNKSGKLNNKGKKIRKIATSLTLFTEIKNPTFKIFDPSGTLVPENNGSFNFQVVNQSPSQPAASNKFMKIELTYSLNKKIGPGLYRIEILNDNKHAGNLLVRFR